MCLAPVFLAESVSMAGDSLRRCMRGGSIGIEGALLLSECRRGGNEPPCGWAVRISGVTGMVILRSERS